MANETLEEMIGPERQLTASLPSGYEVSLAKALVLADEIVEHKMFRATDSYEYLETIALLLDMLDIKHPYKFPDAKITGISHQVRKYIVNQILETKDMPLLERVNFAADIVRKQFMYVLGGNMGHQQTWDDIHKYLKDHGSITEQDKLDLYKISAPIMLDGNRFNFARRMYEKLGDKDNLLRVAEESVRKGIKLEVAFDIYKNLGDTAAMETVALRSAEVGADALAGRQALSLASCDASIKELNEKLGKEYIAIERDSRSSGESVRKKLEEDRQRDIKLLYMEAAKSLYKNGLYKASAVAYAQADIPLGISAVFSHYIHEHQIEDAIRLIEVYGSVIKQSKEATDTVSAVVKHLEEHHENDSFIKTVNDHLGIPYQLRLPYANTPTGTDSAENPSYSIRITNLPRGEVIKIRDHAFASAHTPSNI